MKRWHTNKTQPLGLKGGMIIIIFKHPHLVDTQIPFLDDFGQLCISEYGLWKNIKKDIKYWAYVDKYFEKELKEEL